MMRRQPWKAPGKTSATGSRPLRGRSLQYGMVRTTNTVERWRPPPISAVSPSKSKIGSSGRETGGSLTLRPQSRPSRPTFPPPYREGKKKTPSSASTSASASGSYTPLSPPRPGREQVQPASYLLFCFKILLSAFVRRHVLHLHA